MDAKNIRLFGCLADGQAVYGITLDNGEISCEVITFGAALRTLLVPDRDGKAVDVVLGYDNLEQYLTEDGYLGATVGRVANRIAGAKFNLNGQEYILPRNDGNNHLHGGLCGFSHRLWEIEKVTDSSVLLSLMSPDGDEGYPGTMKATAEYSLCGNRLVLRYCANSDKDTLCSFTNHSYFNLSGHNSGCATEQKVKLFAQSFTPSNAESIPLGTVTPVERTVMDFREMLPIHTHITEPDLQLLQARGYDHNFVLEGTLGKLHPAAIAESERSGIVMQVETTLPGIHFYTSNYLNEGRKGKGGCAYGPRHGFCLETHFHPDAIHHANFPSPVLKAGETYAHETVYTFSCTK